MPSAPSTVQPRSRQPKRGKCRLAVISSENCKPRSGVRLRWTLALALSSVIAACDSPTAKEDVGGVAGLVIGGIVGAAFGDGVGQILSGFVGATAGGIAGSEIGKRLDEADRLKAKQAAHAALSLPKGETVEWKSDRTTSVSGTATPTTSTTRQSGKLCRQIREVVFIGGKERTDFRTYCKSSATGRWSLVG